MRLLQWPKTLKAALLICKDRASVPKIHALMIVSGIFSHQSFYAQLVAVYGRTGNIELARHLFDKLPQRRIDVWNAMITAYSRQGCLFEVIDLYHQMFLESVRPDSSTFTVAIKACSSLFDLEMGEKIRLRAVEFGYGNDIFVESSLLNLYAKCGMMDEAMSIFNKMVKKDLVSWTTMVTGFAQSGHACEAIDFYRMMRKEGMEGDEIAMLGLIQACARIGDKKMGLSVHGYMIRRDFPIGVVVQTSLVDMFSKTGNLDLASRFFKKIRHKNVVCWSALISGYAQNGFAIHALELLIDMQNFGYIPDSASLVSALLACSHIGFLKLGRSIHGYIVRKHNSDEISCTALIDMYSKSGSLSSARALFDRISHRDLICWNTMIACYGIHGRGREALSLFLEMREKNLIPDHATFSSLLSALSHSGLVEEGLYWFDLMVKKFKIQPSEKHCACMVDLLARAGKVEEACDLIDAMGYEPGLTIWVSILSGCQTHQKLLIGEMAAEKIMELNPDEPGIYALVSNFFATARMWNEVAGIRRAMKQTGNKKVPGYSSVEVNRKFHAFVMGDKSHLEYEQIVGMLKQLEHEMRDMGYVPNTEFGLLSSLSKLRFY